MRYRLGNLSSLEQDLEDVNEGLKYAEGSSREQLLKDKEDIEREIEELRAAQSSNSDFDETPPKSTSKKSANTKTRKQVKDKNVDCADPKEVKDLKEEISRLKRENAQNAGRRKRNASSKSKRAKANANAKRASGQGKNNTTSPQRKRATANAKRASGQGKGATRRKKGVAVDRGGAKVATNNGSTATKRTKGQSAAKTVTSKRTATKKAGENTQTQEAKAPKVNKRAQAQQAKREAQVIANSAKSNDITQKVGKSYMNYLYISDAVKKFAGKIGKEASHGWFFNLYTAIENGNKAKRFTSESPAFGAMKIIFESLQTQLNKDDFARGSSAVVGKDLSAEDKKLLTDIVEADKGFLTAHYVKRFVGITKSKNKKAADALVKAIKNAKEKKGVTSDMLFYSEMEEARKKAEKYDFTVSHTLKGVAGVESNLKGFVSGLGSLAGLGCTCQTSEKKKYSSRSVGNTEEDTYDDHYEDKGEETDEMTASQIRRKHYDVYHFEGEWKNIIKNPGRNFSAMVYGAPGNGKTAMCLQLAQYLADHFGKVLYVSGEEHDSATLQDNMEQNNVDGTKIIFSQDFRGKDLTPYKFVFLDSIQVLDLSEEEFIDLKREYPETAFILVFQTTKEGEFRGNQTWKHNVDAVIRVKDFEAQNFKRLNGGGVYGIR